MKIRRIWEGLGVRLARLLRGRRRAGSLLALLLLLAESASGANSGAAGNYLTDVWTSENGLPDSSVTAIAQTPDGYLWVGTYNGLARFDGVRFVTFDPANTPALTHARVRKLFVDARGTLWINTYDGSLTTVREGVFALEWADHDARQPEALLVSSTAEQVVFRVGHGDVCRKSLAAPPGKGWEMITPAGRIGGATCCSDSQGNLWYIGRERRLWRLRGNLFEPLPSPPGLTSGTIRCMVTDPRGRLWVGTDQEIAVWNGARFQTVTPTNAPAGFNPAFLFVMASNRFWSVANGRLRLGGERQWALEVESLRGVFTGNLGRTGALEEHHGGIWLYDYGRGLFHVGADGQARQLGAEDGFPGERVNCFFEDREGNWWAGLDTAGLVRLRERRFQTVADGDGFPAKAARSVCEDHNGSVWVGTLGGGLMRWEQGSVSSLAVPGGTTKGFVFCVCPDKAGRLWVSAGDEDLFVYEQGGFKPVTPTVHGVKAILADRAGRIWVGTKSGLMVSEGGPPWNFQPLPEVDRQEVRALAEDAAGVIWAGSGLGTLYRIADRKVTGFNPTDVPRPHAILSLLADADGTIWAGTFRGGLLRFEAQRFTRFDKGSGLADNVISQLLADEQGYLWLGSQQGIFRVAKAELQGYVPGQGRSLPCILYGRHDGLPSSECSSGYQPAAWRGQDGRLWFTTLKGVASVQPREVRPNLLPPPVVIEEVLVDGQAQSLEGRVPGAKFQAEERGKSGGGKGSSPGGERAVGPGQGAWLEVGPGKRQFEFRYTGLSLVSPDAVQFRYWLEGVDAHWVEAGPRRSAQYSFLPPGLYRFRVAACNSDQVWNEAGASLELRVLPHVYETWWFRVLAGVTGIGLIAGTVRQTAHRRLRRRMEQLERQQAVERERTRIAKDIHDDLGAGLTQITLLSELARGEPGPEGQMHLGQISESARELTRAMDEIVWAIDPQNDTLDGLATYVCKFAQEYLQLAGIRCRLDLPEQLPPHPLRAEVRHNLFLAVKEALNNILKHARATEVTVRLTVAEQAFSVVIEDNGQGFAAGARPAEGGGRILSGHGLGNLEKRLASLGGRCVLQSQPGQGTRVELSVRFDAPATISPVLASS